MPVERCPTGVPSIDALLGGGLEMDCLTELYGEGGSGKTLLCIEVAVRLALADRWVFYIDTEGVSVDRLEAVAGGKIDRVLHRLLLSTPRNIEEQTRAVETAASLTREGRRPVGLIVLDSATFYYRLSLSGPDEEGTRIALASELAELLATALAAQVPVVFTNQVWRRPSDGSLEPLGGSFVNHAAKTILRLDRLAGPRRRAVLVKHRSLGEGSADFEIGPTGLGSGPGPPRPAPSRPGLPGPSTRSASG
ncbi:MAG TPA: DNA repair and recombination protein RadB [Thermoplasmata archaeon]|nr:DNA repair and recombination protein RadB [Thermoplasmata archaeon]